MRQRFTSSADRVLFFAFVEAARLGDAWVRPEHLLLGLTREADSVAARVLESLGASVKRLRRQLKKEMPRGEGDAPKHVMFDVSSRAALDLAVEEASRLGQRQVGPEHLLLGVIQEMESQAAQVLSDLGVTLEVARFHVARYVNIQPTFAIDHPVAERFRARARRALGFAEEEAAHRGETEVTPEHLLLGLLREGDTLAARVLASVGVEHTAVREALEKRLPHRRSRATPEERMLHPRTHRVLDRAWDEAPKPHHQGVADVGTEHLLLGIVGEEDGPVAGLLAELGVTAEQVRLGIESHLGSGGSLRGAIEQRLREAMKRRRLLEAPMWQRFTDRAKRLVFFAQEEAAHLGENYVSPEHLLLGLVREGDSVAVRVLDRLGVPPSRVRAEVERRVVRGEGRTTKDMTLDPRARKVLDLAYDEARQLNNDHIGTEHLLLGLIREGDGLAARILSHLGVDLLSARRELIVYLTGAEGVPPAAAPGERAKPVAPDEIAEAVKRVEVAVSGLRQVVSRAETVDAGQAFVNSLPDVLRGRSLLSIGDLSVSELAAIFGTADRLKAMLKQNPPVMPPVMEQKTLAMIFEKPSLRTRVSFETGMTQLGGHAINLQPAEVQLGKRESIADAACTLGRMVDVIMARTFAHQTVADLAQHAGVPVINGLSDLEHPCQALADFMTIREKKEHLRDLEIAWVGDGNNVCHSNLLLAAKVGAHFTMACPEGHDPDPEIVALAEAAAAESGARIRLVRDPFEAVKDADVIFTDVWASMGQEAEQAQRAKTFAPFQVNQALVDLAKPDSIVLHCLPAHRGDEITDEVIDGPHSVVFDEAENRLHAQKALLVLLA